MPPCNAFNSSCLCDDETFSPICGNDGLTYYSPCHAGCTLGTNSNDGKNNYSNCSCMIGETCNDG